MPILARLMSEMLKVLLPRPRNCHKENFVTQPNPARPRLASPRGAALSTAQENHRQRQHDHYDAGDAQPAERIIFRCWHVLAAH